jgi:hypothetical protein
MLSDTCKTHQNTLSGCSNSYCDRNLIQSCSRIFRLCWAPSERYYGRHPTPNTRIFEGYSSVFCFKEDQHTATVIRIGKFYRSFIKSSRTIILISWLEITAHRRSEYSHITALITETLVVSETSVISKQLTWLIAREDFINVSLRESSLDHTLSLICFTIL